MQRLTQRSTQAVRPVTRATAVGLATLLLFVSATAAAAEPPADAPSRAAPSEVATPQWTLQIDPLTTALGFVHLQVERAVAPHVSIYAGPHLRLFDSLLDKKKEPFTGVGVELGVRYFLNPSAPAGAWAQVRGVVARLQTDRNGGKTAMGGYGSVLAGYTAIFAERWVLAGGLGVQYLHYYIDGMGPKRLFVAAHTTFGVPF